MLIIVTIVSEYHLHLFHEAYVHISALIFVLDAFFGENLANQFFEIHDEGFFSRICFL